MLHPPFVWFCIGPAQEISLANAKRKGRQRERKRDVEKGKEKESKRVSEEERKGEKERI